MELFDFYFVLVISLLKEVHTTLLPRLSTCHLDALVSQLSYFVIEPYLSKFWWRIGNHDDSLKLCQSFFINLTLLNAKGTDLCKWKFDGTQSVLTNCRMPSVQSYHWHTLALLGLMKGKWSANTQKGTAWRVKAFREWISERDSESQVPENFLDQNFAVEYDRCSKTKRWKLSTSCMCNIGISLNMQLEEPAFPGSLFGRMTLLLLLKTFILES